MTFTKDSPIAVKVVPAPDNWTRSGWSVSGITIHMAEGGGTVSWLTRNDGNSSHYVVQYDGSVVQMVDEERSAGSVNPRTIRMNNDPAFAFLGEAIRYGRVAAVGALGVMRAGDPNRSVIAIEVEGFAATGPNAKQRTALKLLINDIRRRKGVQPTLGHRDFQQYKACPGHKIPWVDYGGHGKKVGFKTVLPTPPVIGVDVAIQGSTVPEVPTRLHLKDDPAKAGRSRWLYVWSDHRADPGNKQLEPQRPLLLTRFIDADTYAVAYEPAAGDANATSLEMFVRSEDVASTEAIPSTDPTAIKTITDPLNHKIDVLTGRIATIKAKIAANAVDVADE